MMRAPGRPSPLLIATMISCALWACVPLFGACPNADLNCTFTDQNHHTLAAYTFLFRGFGMYTRTFGASAEGITFPMGPTWEQLPLMYPPGMVVGFLPAAFVAKVMDALHFGARTVNSFLVLYIVVIAHASLYAFTRALFEGATGSRWIVILAAWPLFGVSAANGFYDPWFVGAGAMGVIALLRGRNDRAVLWTCAALLLHYRAAVFVPVAAIAWLRLWQEKHPKRVAITAFSAACAVAFIVPFLLAYPLFHEYHVANHWTNILRTKPHHLSITAACTAATLGVLAWKRDLLGALVLLVTYGLALAEYMPCWWHGIALLAPVVCTGVWRAERDAELSRAAVLAWATVILGLVWHPQSWLLSLTHILENKAFF